MLQLLAEMRQYLCHDMFEQHNHDVIAISTGNELRRRIRKVEYELGLSEIQENFYELYAKNKSWLLGEPLIAAIQRQINLNKPPPPPKKIKKKTRTKKTPSRQEKLDNIRRAAASGLNSKLEITSNPKPKPTPPPEQMSTKLVEIMARPKTPYDQLLEKLRQTATSEGDALRQAKALIKHLSTV